MEINEFAKPYSPKAKFSNNQLGSHIYSFNRIKKWDKSIFICGVSDLNGKISSIDNIREVLYSLSIIDQSKDIIDFGNIISLSEKDQEAALKGLLKEAKKNQSPLVLLSESSEVLPQFIANESTKDKELVVVSPIIYDGQLISKAKKNLKSLTFLGVQSYFNLNHLNKDKKNSEIVALGELRDDLMDVEPYFRMSNNAIFDLSAIRKSDYSLSYRNSPNGLYAEEICQLAWFAGNSDTIDSFCITNLSKDSVQTQDKMMSAQLIWYILTGIAKRYSDNPGKNTRNFKEYYIENNKTPEDLVFYKSMKSEKFWVKYGQEKIFIPCSKKDMSVVLEGNIPDRLLKKIAVNQKKQ
ncbi:MAG: hypothetical protein C0599_07750 [Salinivirgaceae bacterium]|nr:MAG: hypothetical protein C0599_07750 [Salinivirgaceae bacterium]